MTAINYKKSIFWMILWSFCFSIVMTLAKKISPEISGATLIFGRLSIGLAFAMPLFIGQGIQTVIQTQFIGFHLIRAGIVTCAMGCTPILSVAFASIKKIIKSPQDTNVTTT